MPLTATGVPNKAAALVSEDAPIATLLDGPVVSEVITKLPLAAVNVAPVIPFGPPNAVIQFETVSQLAPTLIVCGLPPSTVTIKV